MDRDAVEKEMLIIHFTEEANWIGFYGEQAEKYAEDNYKEWKVKMDIVRANAKKNVEANGCHQRGEV
jgi:hypothetical protein